MTTPLVNGVDSGFARMKNMPIYKAVTTKAKEHP